MFTLSETSTRKFSFLCSYAVPAKATQTDKDTPAQVADEDFLMCQLITQVTKIRLKVLSKQGSKG